MLLEVYFRCRAKMHFLSEIHFFRTKCEFLLEEMQFFNGSFIMILTLPTKSQFSVTYSFIEIGKLDRRANNGGFGGLPLQNIPET